jgi:hypothetical protein
MGAKSGKIERLSLISWITVDMADIHKSFANHFGLPALLRALRKILHKDCPACHKAFQEGGRGEQGDIIFFAKNANYIFVVFPGTREAVNFCWESGPSLVVLIWSKFARLIFAEECI